MPELGLIGAGAMGRNLALNIARHGFSLAVYDRLPEAVRAFNQATPHPGIYPASTLEAFFGSLKRPRCIWLMVNAGKPVDEILEQLRPHLAAGDLIVDGGNSHFQDTERRSSELGAEAEGIYFLGIGVSGGAEGALHGASLMAGGAQAAYKQLEPLLKSIAARSTDGQPCVAYLGPGGAGHYVKMVHNGIEYAMMQAIAEVYDLLRRGSGRSTDELASLFTTWNAGPLGSFLVEITARIFHVVEPGGSQPLIDLILDTAQQKGTGQWTSQEALRTGIPVSAITVAVEARLLSAFKEKRQQAARLLPGPEPVVEKSQEIVEAAHSALQGAMLVAYDQGFALLQQAAQEHGYAYSPAEIARIWRAGCIIRSSLLEEIYQIYRTDPQLPTLLLADSFRECLSAIQPGWRTAIKIGIEQGIPLPLLGTSLAYYDGYRSERLPSNLIQAQRDYFGAHTYARVDQPGVFHTEWKSGPGPWIEQE